jgi:hypothetical protein
LFPRKLFSDYLTFKFYLCTSKVSWSSCSLGCLLSRNAGRRFGRNLWPVLCCCLFHDTLWWCLAAKVCIPSVWKRYQLIWNEYNVKSRCNSCINKSYINCRSQHKHFQLLNDRLLHVSTSIRTSSGVTISNVWENKVQKKFAQCFEKNTYRVQIILYCGTWWWPYRTATGCNLTLNKWQYRGADKPLARPTSRCILFDGENISFDASLFIHINSTNIPPIMVLNRIYEHQNLLSL